jgi:hypothetical protein
MYCAVLIIGIKNNSAVQPVVAVERTVFYRERAAGMYSTFPYAFGQASISYFVRLLQDPPKSHFVHFYINNISSVNKNNDHFYHLTNIKDIKEKFKIYMFSKLEGYWEELKLSILSIHLCSFSGCN